MARVANRGGAPKGNTNAAKGRPWRDAIDRALAIKGRYARKCKLDELAEKLVGLAYGGDLGALKEVGDRLDGRPAQVIQGVGEGDAILLHTIRHEIVDPKGR